MSLTSLIDLDLLSRFKNKILTTITPVPTVHRTASIPFAQVDSTSTSTAYTATVPGITELRDGVCVMLMNGRVTSESGFTVNINNLGAKPVYSTLSAASRATTLFNVNYTLLLVYNTVRVAGGCWDAYYGYDSNTNTIGYQLRTNSTSLPMNEKVYRYRLLFTSANGEKWVAANASSSTNATASRTVNQTPINPFGAIRYYGYTTAIDAGSRPGTSYMWSQYNITLGYSFNRTGAALTLTSWKPVYIKCAPQSDGSAIMDADTPYVQALPSTADGKIYIFLGIATAATTVELVPEHPVYCYRNGGLQLWTGVQREIDALSIPTKTSDLTNDSGYVTSVISLSESSGSTTITKTTYGGTAEAYAVAPSASPALTGTPTAPTAASGTNTAQIATTAFVQTEVGALTIPDELADLTADSTHRTVTDTEKATWNAKQDAALIGQVDDSSAANYVTPTQVYNALVAGKDVLVTKTDNVYGVLKFSAWNIADTMSTLISNVIVQYNSAYILYELVGDKSNNTWTRIVTLLQQSLDFDTEPTNNSSNPVTSNGIYDALATKPDVISVKAYGAIGDGSTDDTAAFTSALTSTSRGATVYVPDGQYKLTSTIRIPEFKMLVLSGSVELLFTQTSTPCIKVNRFGKLRGNGSFIIVPYNYTSHALECFTDEDPANADEISGSPFMGATPGWRTMRDVDGICILKKKNADSTQALVVNIANIGGDGVYIGADNIVGTSVSANSHDQWMTRVNANVAGGFSNGFHVEVVDPSDSWMSDIYISGVVEAAETGVLIENVTGGVFCDVVVQPQRAIDSNQTKYAKNGIKIIDSVNADLSRSKVWDWDSNHTLKTGNPPTDQYQAYALIGRCPGAIINDFGMLNSNNTNYNRIYTDNIDNLINAMIIGSKGLMAPPPAYVFYKNNRNGNDDYNSDNVAWRDRQNMVRYQLPVTPLNAYSNPSHLYRIGYFDFADAENPVSGFSDTLPSQTITIEENDSRGIFGYTNINFASSSATPNSYWNPVGFGYGGRVPLYYYSSSGTRKTIYRLVRDAYDIQQIYNCSIFLTNARRFIFDFADMGAISSLSQSTYLLMQPKYADGAELHMAGTVIVDNGAPIVCTESSVFNWNGTVGTSAVTKELALAEDIPDIAELHSETVPGYTNQVPISTDTSGNIYNSTGYKQGYGLNSNGEETANSVCYVTGFIPIQNGDIVRVQDPSVSSFDTTVQFARYKANKATGNGIGKTVANIVATPATYGAMTITGNLVEWTISSGYYFWNDTVYLRVTSRSANTIVTVNEQIRNITRQYGVLKSDVKVTEDNIILNSSTSGSIKQFAISVNDSGVLSATEIVD